MEAAQHIGYTQAREFMFKKKLQIPTPCTQQKESVTLYRRHNNQENQKALTLSM